MDENDQIVEKQYCDDEATNEGAYPGAFFWYYGGSLAGRAIPGTKLSGGDRVSTSNVAENARRGGFGAGSKTSSSGVGRVASSRSSGG